MIADLDRSDLDVTGDRSTADQRGHLTTATPSSSSSSHRGRSIHWPLLPTRSFGPGVALGGPHPLIAGPLVRPRRLADGGSSTNCGDNRTGDVDANGAQDTQPTPEPIITMDIIWSVDISTGVAETVSVDIAFSASLITPLGLVSGIGPDLTGAST
jgi:hypothetical protein